MLDSCAALLYVASRYLVVYTDQKLGPLSSKKHFFKGVPPQNLDDELLTNISMEFICCSFSLLGSEKLSYFNEKR